VTHARGAGIAAGTGAAGTPARYRRITRQRTWLLAALAAALLASVAADVGTGPSGLPLATLVQGLLDPQALAPAERVILWNLRLPHALLAAAAGASLGLAGAETQTALNNPLASPYTLGISWAAAVGAVAAIVLGLEGIGTALLLPLAAFAMALAAGLAILALAQVFGSQTDTVILFGIALVFACTAVISLLQFLGDAETVQQSVVWMMGSLARASWNGVGLIALTFALAAPRALRGAWAMTLLRGGEDQATSAGLSVHRMRIAALLRCSLLTAVTVAFVGPIGFVGLVGPHIARLLLGEDHRFYLPGAALTGALLLSLAAIASKLLIAGVVIPVGIVTAMIGVPVFVALIVARRRRL